MHSKLTRSVIPALIVLSITMVSCGSPAVVITSTPENTAAVPETAVLVADRPMTATASPAVLPTETVPVLHVKIPASPRGGKLVYDVESATTSADKRAPYGDSYDINRLERPFLQDMTYVSDLDINSFKVTKDDDWWYVTIELIGSDPNNALSINYGAELDLDHDGFGDYLIWAQPPYLSEWDTGPVKIYQDTNHNTGGISGVRSDAPFDSDGYETLIFDGSLGGSDPDLAWARVNVETAATVQFAFKKSWSGIEFMLGVIADAGLKDPGKLDYVDRFPIGEAGSPMKENENYPLKALFAVDNTCREAFGFEPTFYEPQICPVIAGPTRTPDPSGSGSEPGLPQACLPPANMGCPNGWDPIKCVCQ